jgi:carbonic anhydrase
LQEEVHQPNSSSLTTPPCTENVIWTVFTDPLTITRQQLSLLRAVKDCRGKLIAKNYRPGEEEANGI